MKNLPLISIVITNYNRGATLEVALKSALKQSYPNLEIIVSDNCSTDNSDQIISKYLYDDRLKYYRNSTNLGMLENFRLCFEERANGNYISIVNSDDELIDDDFVTNCYALTQKYEQVFIVKSSGLIKSKQSIKQIDISHYKEFYSGKEFLNVFNPAVDFGWAGILLDKNKINDLQIFSKNIIAFDYVGNLNLLLRGNICFYQHPSYQFNIHEANEGKISFSQQQIENIKNELNSFFEKLKLCSNVNDAKSIEHKIKLFFIDFFYQANYVNNRKQINLIEKSIEGFDEKIFRRYITQPKTIKFKLLYFWPKVGQKLTKYKKEIFD